MASAIRVRSPGSRSLERIVHDLKGPVAAMRAALYAARSGWVGSERAFSLLERSVRHLEALLRRGGEEPEEGDVRIDLLLAEVVEGLAGGAAEVRLEAVPVSVRGREIALRSLFSNLVANALEHGGGRRGTAVRVRCRLGRGGRLLVDVTDRGPGFEGAPRREGGLGVRLARAAAALHGGRVVWRARPGAGCRAFVEIPAGRVNPASAAEA